MITFALSFLWLVMGSSAVFWLAAVSFSAISRRFVYTGRGDNSPRIIFQITTKDCPETVDRAVESIRKSCGETGFTNYDIWVVTINSHPRLGDDNVRRVIVPEEFQCAGKYKARSLEFVRRVRTDEGYAGWVYFIDEENWVTGQTVKAITHFAAHGNAKFASGPLGFNNGGSYLAWLGDSLRRAEARISHLEHYFGWWPVHGDNMLLHFEVEKEIGWEFKEFTEDVQFSGHALRKGYRTGWHGGELQTMSPTSLADFIKQRRRWFRGMLQCIFSRGVGVNFKLLQAWFLLSGLTVAFIFIGIPVDLFYGFTFFSHTWYYSLPVISIYSFSYFAGCNSNLKDKITAVLFSGLFSMFEGIGAWGSIVRPPKDFDIIKKT